MSIGGGDIGFTGVNRPLAKVVTTEVMSQCSDRKAPVAREQVEAALAKILRNPSLNRAAIRGAYHTTSYGRVMAYFYMKLEAAAAVLGGSVPRTLVESLPGRFRSWAIADELLTDMLVQQLCPNDRDPPPPPSPVLLPRLNPKRVDVVGDEPTISPEAVEAFETGAKAAVGVGAAYGAYRALRMIPSLIPPLWWTIPGNVVIP